MLKLVKAVSIISVVLAAVTVATVGYLIVFSNDALRQRQEVLEKLSAIEAFRKIIGAMPIGEEQVSPLVEEAHKLALRINPPKPPKPVRAEGKTDMSGFDKIMETVKPIKVKTRFNLLATCLVADNPQKSLALIAESAKEKHSWVREGTNIGHLTVHQINDGSIVLYQGSKEHSIMDVQKRPASKLLKTPPKKPESYIVRKSREQMPSTRDVSNLQQRTALRKEKRKLPLQPTAKEKEAVRKNSVTKLQEKLKEVQATPASKEQAETLAAFNELLKILEPITQAGKSKEDKTSEKKK